MTRSIGPRAQAQGWGSSSWQAVEGVGMAISVLGEVPKPACASNSLRQPQSSFINLTRSLHQPSPALHSRPPLPLTPRSPRSARAIGSAASVSTPALPVSVCVCLGTPRSLKPGLNDVL